MSEPELRRDDEPPQGSRLGWVFNRVFFWTAGLGAVGFATGFVGPMVLTPGSNLGPIIGILVTGPAGVVLGLFLGGIAGLTPRRRRRLVSAPWIVACCIYFVVVLLLITAG